MAGLGVAWDESTTGILSVLVFGAGTDYALLLISRYRDELKPEESRNVAMAPALRRTAEAVLASATTVVLGLLTLLLSLIPTTRGLGLACAIGIVVAAASCCWCCRPSWCSSAAGSSGRGSRTSATPPWSTADGLWRRVGDRVAAGRRRSSPAPWCCSPLLAAGVSPHHVGLDDADQFLDKPEAISAAERLAESFPAGAHQSDPGAHPRRPGAGAARPSRRPTASRRRARAADGQRRHRDRRGARRPRPARTTPSRPSRRCATAWRRTTTRTSAGSEAPDDRRACRPERDRLLILPLDPAAGARRAAGPAPLGRGAAAAGRDGASRPSAPRWAPRGGSSPDCSASRRST